MDSSVDETSAMPSLDISARALADALEDEVLVIDGDYRIRFANAAVRSRLKNLAEPAIGSRCYEALKCGNGPGTSPLWGCPLREVLQSGEARATTHRARIHGAERYLKILVYPFPDGSGSARAVLELRRDVTSDRELETQILRRHHQLQALSHISSAASGQRDLDAILKIALDNVLELVNGTIGGILLLDEKAGTLSYRVHHGLSAKYAEEMRMRLGEGVAGEVARTGKPALLEDISRDNRAARPDLIGAEGLHGFLSIPLKSRDIVMGVMNIASYEVGRFGSDDLSLLSSIGDYLGAAIEQARLYERLARAVERSRTLLQHALTAQEDERKRIARELHDETSQAITSLTLSLQAAIGMAEMKGYGDAQFMDTLRKMHSYAVHAGREVVQLMKELRPTLLDELGLPAAIHRYAKDTLQPRGISISAGFKGVEKRLRPEIEVTLFRVAQGAIGNILKHSEAKNASIRLECDANWCRMYIEDDGRGFDVSRLTQVDPGGRGAGLFTMKERARLVGGACRCDSSPGKGTKVTVRVPLSRQAMDAEDNGLGS